MEGKCIAEQNRQCVTGSTYGNHRGRKGKLYENGGGMEVPEGEATREHTSPRPTSAELSPPTGTLPESCVGRWLGLWFVRPTWAQHLQHKEIHMRKFTFTRGQWTDGHSLPEWDGDDGEDHTAYIRRIGYGSPCGIEAPDMVAPILEAYAHDTNETFLAFISPDRSSIYEVFLPDFISLMMFLKDYAPALGALEAASNQAEIVETLRKLFLLYHGHASYMPCAKCSPLEWKQNVEAAEARRKREDAKG